MWEEIELKIEVMKKDFPDQPNEIEEGNKEYKWKIFSNDEGMRKENKRNITLKCNKLASQMNWRCNEGYGNAVYILGVMDDGESVGIGKLEMYKTLLFIISAANIINASVNKIRLYRGIKGTIATIRISLNNEEQRTI